MVSQISWSVSSSAWVDLSGSWGKQWYSIAMSHLQSVGLCLHELKIIISNESKRWKGESTVHSDQHPYLPEALGVYSRWQRVSIGSTYQWLTLWWGAPLGKAVGWLTVNDWLLLSAVFLMCQLRVFSPPLVRLSRENILSTGQTYSCGWSGRWLLRKH